MRSRKQEIAYFCWEKINSVKEKEQIVKKEFSKNLKQYVKSSGPLILNNGLIESLIFYLEKMKPKGEDKEKSKSIENLAYQELYEIINEYWKKFIPLGKNKANQHDLYKALILDCSTTELLEITDRVLYMLNLLKRIASAEISD